MSYIPLYELLPRLAEKETRTISVLGKNNKVPVGDYGLVEMYCNDENCDCRRVFINVVSARLKRSVAVIAYGWEDIDYYEKWAYLDTDDGILDEYKQDMLLELKGPYLNTLSPQSSLAPDLLALVNECALSDEFYVNRLKRHYRLFKKKVDK